MYVSITPVGRERGGERDGEREREREREERSHAQEGWDHKIVCYCTGVKFKSCFKSVVIVEGKVYVKFLPSLLALRGSNGIKGVTLLETGSTTVRLVNIIKIQNSLPYVKCLSMQ